MDRLTAESFARVLRRQRARYLQEFRNAERGLEVIAEDRESELEEHAQEEQAARLLSRLDDQTLSAVKEIDAALQRILRGTYGNCEICHRPVSLARLRILPAAGCCRACSARNERPHFSGREAAAPPRVPVPADLSLLSDSELVQAIREHLQEDGRIDMEELHVAFRGGVVYLSGALPSEPEHQILLQTLTDVMGFEEIVDHLETANLLWQSEKRTREVGPELTARWQEPPASEDIVESTEDDREFVAPAKPTPGEE